MAIQLNLSERFLSQNTEGDERTFSALFKQHFDHILNFADNSDMPEYCAPLAQAADYNLSLKEAEKTNK